MTTVGSILDYLHTLAPSCMKMEWDHEGLLCGSRSTPVNTVLVALDPFLHVCKEAQQCGAQLLVTHHPLIFTPLTSVTDETSVGRCLSLLCRHGISAINLHTNLDCAPGGVNDVLAQTLGLTHIQVLNPQGVQNHKQPWGLLRGGEVPPQSLDCFLSHVKQALGAEGLRYTDGGKPVNRVAVGGGSCADALRYLCHRRCQIQSFLGCQGNGYQPD